MDLLDIRIPDDPFLEPVAIIFVLASRLAVFERVLDFTNDPVQYFHVAKIGKLIGTVFIVYYKMCQNRIFLGSGPFIPM